MADTIGGVVPLPTMDEGAYVPDPEILWSSANLIQIGVTIKSGFGEVVAGTVLGRITDSGKYAPYNDNASDGTQVARGVLRLGVDTTTDCLGNLVLGGVLRNSKLTGLNANAITDLGARQDTVLDVVIF